MDSKVARPPMAGEFISKYTPIIMDTPLLTRGPLRNVSSRGTSQRECVPDGVSPRGSIVRAD